MKVSTLDIVAAALVATILLGPLTAGMLATRAASEQTKEKSLAPVDPAQDSRR